MSSWQVHRLEEICKVVAGGTPKTKVDEYWNGDIPWLTPKDLSGYNSKYIDKGYRNITKLGLANSSAKLFPAHTVVLSSRAPIGYTAISAVNATTNQGMKALIPNPGTDTDFLYYLIKYNVPKMLHYASGSTFKEISTSGVRNIVVNIPLYEEQQAIANILSSLDEKIELNNKINKNLEETAQLLYKQWFVNFEFPNKEGEPYKSNGGEMIGSELGYIPEGWEIKSFNDISSLMMGLSPKGISYNEDNVGKPLVNGAADYSNGLLNPRRFTSQPTRVCKKNDLVFCIRATIGNIVYADKEYCLGRGVAALTPNEDIYKGIIWHSLDKSMKRLINGAAGSVILGLKKDDINNLKVIIPKEKYLLRKYYSVFQSNMELVSLYRKEINSLTNLRDTILPKLMSGEIRVPIKE